MSKYREKQIKRNFKINKKLLQQMNNIIILNLNIILLKNKSNKEKIYQKKETTYN